MSLALDTSAVVCLLVGEPPDQTELVRRQMARSPAPLWVDALVVGESYFALRHHYRIPHRDAVEALRALLASDRVAARDEVRAVLADARHADHPGLMDRLIVAAAQEQGRLLLTLDRKLARLDGARLLD